MNDNDIQGLPDISDEAIGRIEARVFDVIADDSDRIARPGTRAAVRRRRWLTTTGIAAAFVVGVLVTPPILNAVGGADPGVTEPGTITRDSSGDYSVPEPRTDDAKAAPDSANTRSESSVPSANDDATVREIIAGAYATVQVDDISTAAKTIAAIAEAHDGYVESTEIAKGSAANDPAVTPELTVAYGWISIRIPSMELRDVIDEVGSTGEVLSSSLSKQDVTSTAIDLRARIKSLTSSVQRLTELMARSDSVADLIEAEAALSDRQAQLESYEQQLAALEDQVAMSTLQIELTRKAAPSAADPAGFSDGLLAGWNGLVVSLNALVIAFGFILPWLAVLAAVTLLIWLIRRTRSASRRRRAASEDATE